MSTSTPVNPWSTNVDKEYFVGLWRTAKRDWKKTLVLVIGLLIIFTLTLLSLEEKAIDLRIWEGSVVAVTVVMAVLLRPRLTEKRTKEQVKTHDFDPVSLGTLWFSFALSVWVSQKSESLYVVAVEIFVSVGALAFLVAVFSRSMRSFLNTRASPIVLPTTLLAFVFGFALGWLPALTQVSGVTLELIVYFGFLWIIAMLLVMFRDIRNEFVRILTVVFFLAAAALKFYEGGMIGTIGGLVLTGIAVLLYLVATARLHPYGDVSEE